MKKEGWTLQVHLTFYLKENIQAGQLVPIGEHIELPIQYNGWKSIPGEFPMPAAKRKLHVFLCHASQDKPVVRELYQKLAAEGWIEPWLDKDKILPGQQWQVVIEEAVESADIVIVFLSNHSVQKEGFVQRELRYAYVMALEKPESTIFLIPVRLEDCPAPRSLRDLQWLNYFGVEKDDSYAGLLQALKLRHRQVVEHEKEARAHQEAEEQASQEAAERARLELEERVRKETESRVRAEYEAREKARLAVEQKRPPVVSVVKPLAREAAPVSRASSPTYADRLTLNGMEFCRVPAGKFLMGSAENDKQANDDEKPQHTVEIPYDYWLARFPVTNEQYAQYVKAAGQNHPVSGWQQKKDHPVTQVAWDDAVAYCQWLNDLLEGKLPQNYLLRLPGEAEWEKAARGTDGRIYPWGNTFDKNRCNTLESGFLGTTPVGKYSPQGDSPYGCADLSGNVWEWTRSLYKPYPYQAGDGREDEKAGGGWALRGGSWAGDVGYARCALSFVGPIFILVDDRGFRVVASPFLL